METIEVVIKLPKEIYEKIQQIDRIISGRRNGKTIEFALWNGVKNGTVLPKGHGDLIDRRELKKDVYTTTEWNGDIHRIVYEASVDDAPTVIEADKEVQDVDNN